MSSISNPVHASLFCCFSTFGIEVMDKNSNRINNKAKRNKKANKKARWVRKWRYRDQGTLFTLSCFFPFIHAHKFTMLIFFVFSFPVASLSPCHAPFNSLQIVYLVVRRSPAMRPFYPSPFTFPRALVCLPTPQTSEPNGVVLSGRLDRKRATQPWRLFAGSL